MKWKTLILLISLASPMSMLAAVKDKSTAPGKLISKSVGRVMDHIVTSREVLINDQVERVLYPQKKRKAPLEVSSAGFSKEVTSVLLEWAIYLESINFKATSVGVNELNKALEEVQSRLAQDSKWKKLSVKSSELKKIVERKVQAKTFIRFKVSTSSVPITEDEAREYFKDNRVKFGNLPYKNFETNIKAFLRRQQVDHRLKDWFEVLQAKYKVRNFVSDRY